MEDMRKCHDDANGATAMRQDAGNETSVMETMELAMAPMEPAGA
jgi:hypothetical protein